MEGKPDEKQSRRRSRRRRCFRKLSMIAARFKMVAKTIATGNCNETLLSETAADLFLLQGIRILMQKNMKNSEFVHQQNSVLSYRFLYETFSQFGANIEGYELSRPMYYDKPMNPFWVISLMLLLLWLYE